MQERRLTRWRVSRVWRAALVCAAVAAAVVPCPAEWIERAYSDGLFLRVQPGVTRFSNLAPFALLDVLMVTLVSAWLVALVFDVRRSGLWRGTARILARTVTAAAAFYLAFLLLWGLNYRRVPIAEKVEFAASDITAERVKSTAVETVARLNALYTAAHATGAAYDPTVDGPLSRAFAAVQRALGAPALAAPARPKHTILEPYFRRAAVSGMTDPFFLETLVESRLLPVERPLVVAHEWSHLAGYANEGEANFLGWLVCLRADPAAQYSAWLFFYSEVVPALERPARAEVVSRLDAGPRRDLVAIRERVMRDLNPRVSAAGWRVYDRYLKANRIEAGAASYAEVVRLVLGTRLDADRLPVRKQVARR